MKGVPLHKRQHANVGGYEIELEFRSRIGANLLFIFWAILTELAVAECAEESTQRVYQCTRLVLLSELLK